MEYKYEPVFGDQSLFDGAPEDAENLLTAGFTVVQISAKHGNGASTQQIPLLPYAELSLSLSAGRGKIRRSGGCRKLGLSADKATRMRLL